MRAGKNGEAWRQSDCFTSTHALNKYYYCIKPTCTIGNASLNKTVRHFSSKAKKSVPEHPRVGEVAPTCPLQQPLHAEEQRRLRYNHRAAPLHPKTFLGNQTRCAVQPYCLGTRPVLRRSQADGSRPPNAQPPLLLPHPRRAKSRQLTGRLFGHSGPGLLHSLRSPLQPEAGNTESAAWFENGSGRHRKNNSDFQSFEQTATV